MSYKKIIKIAVLSLGILFSESCTNDSVEKLYPTNDAVAEKIYTSDLKLIIEDKCISCHNFHLEGSNRYDTYEKTKSAIGLMISRIKDDSNIKMPPADSRQLTDDEIAVFEQFVTVLNGNQEVGSEEDDKLLNSTLKWTAYKYPVFEDRAGVSGTFDNIDFTLNKNFEKPEDILKDATVRIETKNVNVSNDELRTSNVGRFFAVFTPVIEGKVINYTDTNANIQFTMNGVTRNISFDVKLESDRVILNGEISDMEVFNWQTGYDELEKVCGELHKNKVWPDITLEAILLIEK